MRLSQAVKRGMIGTWSFDDEFLSERANIRDIASVVRSINTYQEWVIEHHDKRKVTYDSWSYESLMESNLSEIEYYHIWLTERLKERTIPSIELRLTFELAMLEA